MALLLFKINPLVAFCPIFLLELTHDAVMAVKFLGGKILSEPW